MQRLFRKQCRWGKHQLIITSTQYADSTVQGFKDAYWGHRTYFKYAEITPADTKSELTIDGLSEQQIYLDQIR